MNDRNLARDMEPVSRSRWIDLTKGCKTWCVGTLRRVCVAAFPFALVSRFHAPLCLAPFHIPAIARLLERAEIENRGNRDQKAQQGD
jgi:hypothetical protein